MRVNDLGAHRPNCFCWKCTGNRMQCFATMSANPQVMAMPVHLTEAPVRYFTGIPHHSNTDRSAEILRELRVQEPPRGEPYAKVFPFRSQQVTNDQ